MRESLSPKRWWERAMQDREIARLAFKENAEELAEAICCNCQEACEKMLKAYLLSTGWDLVRTHDLQVLGQEAKKTLPAMNEVLSGLVDLTVDFMPTRYPFDAEEGFGVGDAERAISTVEQLHALLKDAVPQASGTK